MNNITKNKFHISFLAKIITTFFLLFGLAGVCVGQEPPPRLEVDFEPDPLFGAENFLPADVANGTITVINNSGEEQDVLVEAINAIDDEGLGDELVLTISEGTNILYDESDGTFGDFLRAGELPLSALPAGGQTTYSFEVEFTEESTGPQGAFIGFDICVGFEGGDILCGDTVIGDEDETDDPSDDDNIFISGASGYIPTPQLSLWGEHLSWSGADGSGGAMVTIEWNTNLLATSKVVYGVSEDDDGNPITYTLDLGDANFGYPIGTNENSPKTKDHLVDIDGLLPNREYKYRVVSRASPPTVSYEHTFFVEMEVGELLDGGEEDFSGDISSGDETGAQDGGTDTSDGTSGTVEDDDLYSVSTEESNKNFLSFLGGTSDFFKSILSGGKIAVDSDASSGKNVDHSGNLASVLFGFLETGSGTGKILFILLLLFLLFVIWRAVTRKSKDK